VAHRLIGSLATTLVGVGLAVVPISPATACASGADVTTSENAILGQAQVDCSGSSSSHAGDSDSPAASFYTAYRTEVVCFVRVGTGSQANGCPRSAPDVCQPGEALYQQYGLHEGTWDPLGQFCQGTTSDAVRPTVTPALVARAFQRIPLPSLRSVTQPADKTLINFDTIFYVDAQPLQRTLTLLGQRVQLQITPSTFRWVHGDGTTGVTHTAGAAYPAKDVVYRYQQAHVTVRQHVEIVWTARWSLNGGPFQDVDGTVTTVGPETPLRVAEATPALSGYGH
jgi:hypothetical protein